MSYYGERNLGNHERTGAASSRKSKKSNSEKPKQPQRGLGVAQLEKIRLHSQMGCAYHHLPPPSLHHNPFAATNLSQEDMRLQTPYSSSSSSSYACLPAFQTMMGNDLERANIRFGDSQPSSTPSWHPGTVYEPQQYAQPNMTRHFLNLQVEDSIEKKRKKDRSDSMGSGSQNNSECNGSQELDLELRL
ncbi:PREDICTED: protein SPEAR3-like [Ipomoea nil]|uniref:protein SPEAR3-like n=1 Tax=Ipomoea nil TaxID=35883 RepID=UPI000901A50D|nr:PREDICTED: protein SPEAR3-like [Ipomoea nil]